MGVVFAVSGRVQGLELFDNSHTFSHYLERLVSSYALSSFADEGNVGTAEKLDADKFILVQELSVSFKVESISIIN